MTAEERAELQQTIKHDIEEVMKEQHHQDHLWIKEWREWQTNIKSTIWKSIVGIIIAVIASLLLYGFILFGQKNFREP